MNAITQFDDLCHLCHAVDGLYQKWPTRRVNASGRSPAPTFASPANSRITARWAATRDGFKTAGSSRVACFDTEPTLWRTPPSCGSARSARGGHQSREWRMTDAAYLLVQPYVDGARRFHEATVVSAHKTL